MKGEKFNEKKGLILCCMLLILLCGCGRKPSVDGTWYNTMDPEEWFLCTEDGRFSEDGHGGTYSFEEGTLVLYYSDGTTEMYTSDNGDEGFVLYDEDGDMWMNNYDDAIAVYDEYCEEKFNKEAAIIPGKWINVSGDIYYEIKEDGTYYYEFDQQGQWMIIGDELQQETGTWEATQNGDSTYIVFTVEKSNVTSGTGGDDRYPGYTYEKFISGSENYGYSIESYYYKQ